MKKSQFIKSYFFASAGILVALFCLFNIYAIGSSNYNISNSVFSSGSGNLSSSNFKSSNVLEKFSANITSNSYNNFLGFWNSIPIDITPPSLTINSPLAQTYSTSLINFNITLNENGYCVYSLTSGATNITMNTTDNRTFFNSSILSDGSYTVRFYCNDSYGNRNDSMNASFSVSTSSPTPQTSGGSSGGSGGGIAKPKETIGDDFSIDIENFNIKIIADEVKTRTFVIKNLKDKPLKINAKTENLEDLIIIPDSIELNPLEQKEISFKITSPSKTEVHTGKIMLDSKEQTKSIFITINPQSKASLFDISIALKSNFINVRDNLEAQVNLVPVGQKGVDVTLKYTIKDFNGKIYHEESETLYVEKEISFIKNFNEVKLEEGNYIIGTELIYPGGFATASSNIRVQKTGLLEKIKSYKNAFLIAFTLAILALIMLKIIKAYKQKRYKSRKTLLIDSLKEIR